MNGGVNWREDKTLIILFASMMLFVLVVLLVVVLRPSDTVLYTLFSGSFSNFSGALLLHLTREKVAPPEAPRTRQRISSARYRLLLWCPRSNKA